MSPPDNYAKENRFKFKGRDKISTPFGGVISFILIIITLIYAGFRLKLLLKKEEAAISVKTLYKN